MYPSNQNPQNFDSNYNNNYDPNFDPNLQNQNYQQPPYNNQYNNQYNPYYQQPQPPQLTPEQIKMILDIHKANEAEQPKKEKFNTKGFVQGYIGMMIGNIILWALFLLFGWPILLWFLGLIFRF